MPPATRAPKLEGLSLRSLRSLRPDPPLFLSRRLERLPGTDHPTASPGKSRLEQEQGQ